MNETLEAKGPRTADEDPIMAAKDVIEIVENSDTIDPDERFDIIARLEAVPGVKA